MVGHLLHFILDGIQELTPDIEVELIYNPEIPPERVGQATLLDPPGLLWAATDF